MKGLFIATALAATLISGTSLAATGTRTVQLNAKLTVKKGAPPSCKGAVCIVKNSGTGTASSFGNVTFTTRITSDGTGAPCGKGSSYVRIIRTIKTSKGNLVLAEGGLQCPVGGKPKVHAAWAVDAARSTGVFKTATGSGTDTAVPFAGANPRGTVTLSQ